mmetsp:Transcript_37/g.58  ORF Transcript_37/g.58 Transcript_37/m.58 type:complete len:472 (-) Transcript_37:283-1698(-)|eukprot:CAMPEP_0196809806 /NCGR_PEP_ID=MMETSP1362-20130617/9687_1 /TAXON_ID=163516 /ORGANISM="Leptocylindrus danicus, Strain CCMP1856" /LENGTH=471 /DNA_ID=CAMNT_0042184601 /DNA_START=426 /DNA_END=1841 /DNA_ORIENTATION=+
MSSSFNNTNANNNQYAYSSSKSKPSSPSRRGASTSRNTTSQARKLSIDTTMSNTASLTTLESANTPTDQVEKNWLHRARDNKITSNDPIASRRFSAPVNRNLSVKRRNSFEVFDGYSSREILACLRGEISRKGGGGGTAGNGNTNTNNNNIPRRASEGIYGESASQSNLFAIQSANDINDINDISKSISAREYVSSLLEVGETRYQYGKYSEALRAFDHALSVQRKMLGNDHVDIAITLTHIGSVQSKMGEYPNALQSLAESLRIHHLRRGENLKDVAHTYQVLGVVYKRSGDLDKAMAAYKEALRLRIMVFGEDHTDVAISYHNIGNIYYEKAEFMKAREAYMKTLSINRGEGKFTKGHVHTAAKLHKIGTILCRLNFFDQGLMAYEEALRVRKATLDHMNMDIATTLMGIADVHERKGNLEKALKSYGEAYNIMNRQLGAGDSEVVKLMSKIGSLYAYVPARKQKINGQ